MSETANIALMADKISSEIFSVFGWKQSGPKNINWPCVSQLHGKTTHPSDVVFFYDDPYRDERIYVETDLKSYSASTLEKGSLSAAIRSLAASTECANQSDEWNRLYATADQNHAVLGMLFVYNHDGEFDSDFSQKLDAVDDKSFSLSKGRRLIVIGPPAIGYLGTVANDIAVLRGKEQLPKASDCKFYYPDLIELRARSNGSDAASIEMLTGPWQILRCRSTSKEFDEDIVMYYRGKGERPDEFMYILDYLFRFQLVEERTRIRLRLPQGTPDAPAVFQRAAEQYAGHFSVSKDIQTRLRQISCELVQNIITTFSEVELGMRNG